MRRREALLLPSLTLASQVVPALPRQLLIGAEDDWAPYSSVVDGRAQGLTVDLVSAALASVGAEARFEPMPYVRCMALTRAGMLMACFNTTRTALIENDYLWPARPMFEERFLIWARSDTPSPRVPLQVRDLESERVAVTRGYEYGAEFDANPRIVRVETARDENNFRLLLRDRAAYTLAPDLNARLLFRRHADLAGRFKVVGQLALFGIYTAFSRSHPQSNSLLSSFNEGMKTIQTNGKAKAIQDRWRQWATAP